MITDIAGIRCGHWTDPVALTGCTVVLLPSGTVGAAEIRGGAPASRELDALAIGGLVDTPHAVVLTGGSAHGLAAADGAMAWCEDNGIGFDTGSGLVPIVPTLAIFDLAVGEANVRPGAAAGRAACESASGGPVELGAVGAGTGATTGKWRGEPHVRTGGIVSATVALRGLIVSALVVVNAFGDVVGADKTGSGNPGEEALGWLLNSGMGSPSPGTNTTIGLVATNAQLDKVDCHLLAQGAHDGLARAIVPPHTRLDGDAFIAVATGSLQHDGLDPRVSVDTVRFLALLAVERAIRTLR